MRSIYINPEGVVCYLPDCPEEPQVCMAYVINSCLHDVCKCHDERKAYERITAAAKDSAVPFADQEQTKKILWEMLNSSPTFSGNVVISKGAVHSLPSGWGVEVKEVLIGSRVIKSGGIPLDFERTYEKVAVLIPPPTSEQEEERYFTVEQMRRCWDAAKDIERSRYIDFDTWLKCQIFPKPIKL